jgi:hypothetical protein
MLSTLLLERAGFRRIEILKESWERKDVSRSVLQQRVLGDCQICYQAALVTPAAVRSLCHHENATNGPLQINGPALCGGQMSPTSLSSKSKAAFDKDFRNYHC